MNPKRILCILAMPLALASCGGGGGNSASISTIQASTARYSQAMTVTVFGLKLDAGIEMAADGPCDNPAASGTATSTQASFTCTVSGFDPITAHIRDANSHRELGSVQVAAALTPRVAISVTDGTRSGTFTVELEPVKAKLTTDNFLAYVNEGFYASTIFHRVIAGFMIQGGGFTTAEAAKPATHPAVKNEASNGLSNLRGTIAMARTDDPDSATSQFYVNLVDNTTLDPGGVSTAGYTVFGHVVSGLDVVDAIGAVATHNLGGAFANIPVTQVSIVLARQIQ